MNAKHFEEWWTQKLLPSIQQHLPAGAVIVMDNAPYHTAKTQASKCPTTSSRKAEIQEWLSQRAIHWTPDMVKKELLDLVKLNKPSPKYVCDEEAEKQGIEVLRLPPYHCIFNPIELVWARLKAKVANINTTYKIGDVQEHVHSVFASLKPELWSGCCTHCDKLVDQAWVNDGLQDEMIDKIIIELGDSDDSDDSDDDDGDEDEDLVHEDNDDDDDANDDAGN
eukprot:scpid77563/ scgid13068/ 